LKKIFIIMALLLVICLMPAASAVQENQLFEVDVSPDVTLSVDIAVVAGGGVSDFLSENLVMPNAVESDSSYNILSGYIKQVGTVNFIGSGLKGWYSTNYHMRN